MLQLLKFDKPIPSALIHALEWVEDANDDTDNIDNEANGHWVYVYAIQTPKEITDDDMETDFIIYEYISNLRVEIDTGKYKDSVNLHFRGLTQYKQILETQRLADITFRNKFRTKYKAENGKNPEISSFAIKVLKHQNYSFDDLEDIGIHCISTIIEANNDNDVFATC